MTEEKRDKTRVKFKTQVAIRAGDMKITSEANSTDISLRGMFVRTDQVLPVDTACHVDILLSGSSSRLSIRVQGRVVREDREGLGIVFDSLDVDSYYHLKNLLLYNAQDPDSLEKEILPIP
ncbi:MAG: PilZ domain-containing protein [Desulfobacterales bacterium]|nr:PilZ domain-containing protein [Desulfobacterales bacterium]